MVYDMLFLNNGQTDLINMMYTHILHHLHNERLKFNVFLRRNIIIKVLVDKRINYIWTRLYIYMNVDI